MGSESLGGERYRLCLVMLGRMLRYDAAPSCLVSGCLPHDLFTPHKNIP